MTVKVDSRLKPIVPSTATFKTPNKTIVSVNNIKKLGCKMEKWHVVFEVETKFCVLCWWISVASFSPRSLGFDVVPVHVLVVVDETTLGQVFRRFILFFFF